MKKNFLTLIFAMCLICPCALIFSACGAKPHTHQYSETLSHNTTHHWAECPCGDKTNYAPHDYDNDCDDTCNTCGYIRVAPHSFSDDCDTTCNGEGCDFTRTVPHDYSTSYANDDANHWYECLICGDKTGVSAHVYTDACDETCNDCGYIRVAPHTFDNDCDTTCNNCNHTRTITHDYSTVYSKDSTHHWYECSICGDKNSYAEHSYTNNCDTSCNDCGYVRSITHDYSHSLSTDATHHWYECTICGDKKDSALHEYDNNCDTDCNICGRLRTINHDYNTTLSNDDDNHWYECSVCGDKTSVGAHVYTDICDETCNDCGYVRVAPHSFDNDCDTTCNNCNHTRITTHDYSTVYSNDSTHHWYECSICGDKNSYAEHSYTNNCDTSCNDCGYVRTISHDYSTDLSYSSTHHWHECSVCGDKTDYALHDFESGICTICEYVDNLTFSYDAEAQAYSVTGVNGKNVSVVTIPSRYNDSTNGLHPVTSIAQEAFLNQTSLTNLTISDSITAIGEHAFVGCDNLTLSVNSNNQTYSCQGNCLIEIDSKTVIAGFNTSTIPDVDNVKYIGAEAFLNCTGLTNVVVPSGILGIGACAFKGCTSLASITLPFVGENSAGSGETCFGYIFNKSTNYSYNSDIPKSLKTVVVTTTDTIGENAFFNCTTLTSITLPDNLISINARAFNQCTASVTIPDSVTTIKGGAFKKCTGFTGDLPSNLTVLGDSAFESCTVITSITIPAGVTKISVNTFAYCTALTNLTISANVSSIDYNALLGSPFRDCSALKNITINSSNATYECTNNCIIDKTTKTLIFGNKYSAIPTNGSVTSIGEYAFDTITDLTTISIPNTVTSIGNNAFYRCTGLTHITIPNSVTSIGFNAFLKCSGLVSISLPFTGATLGGTENTHFSYIFGAETEVQNDYIPKSLQNVTITNVTTLPDKAFIYCFYILNVTFTSELITIGQHAFDRCDSLVSITLPKSLKTIEMAAFHNQDNLTVYYYGTEADWNKISIVTQSESTTNHNNSILNATKYYYSENEPTTDGNFWHLVDNVPTIWNNEE